MDGADDDNGFDAVAVEKSRFLLWIASRTWRLESNTAECLVRRLEGLMVQVQQPAEDEECDNNNGKHAHTIRDLGTGVQRSRQAVLLLTVTTCLSALALLLWGLQITPILRAHSSMGWLDAGRLPRVHLLDGTVTEALVVPLVAV